MQKTLLVNDIMEKNIKNKISLSEFYILKDVVLNSFIEGTLFIVENDDELVGVLTDGDVRRCYSSEKHDISDFVTKRPLVIASNENSSIALRMLRENNINILAVTDDKKLVGYITLHMLLNSFSPERLYITELEEATDSNVERHMARYKFALNFIKKDGYSLDCACGSGYGSSIISKNSAKVLGIDLSEEAIEFAIKNTTNEKIEFVQENIANLQFDNATFDNIISIETLEHVPHEIFLNFLENIAKWLKDGGVFIGSSPMLRYKNGKPYITNPFHINEMAKNEFITAVKSKLNNFEIHFYYQDQETFLPLCEENTGFCIVVARKKQNEL